ncbi:MAG: leucine-rich repeat domain-containing protein [Planctomycetota bacterium]|jgi:internalin A
MSEEDRIKEIPDTKVYKLANTSLLLAVLSLLITLFLPLRDFFNIDLWWAYILTSITCSILALIFGIVSIFRIVRSRLKLKGKTRAIVGIFISSLMAFFLVFLIFWEAGKDRVHFADPALERAVEKQLGIPNPTVSDMLKLEKLEVYEKGVRDLTGLEYATNLKKLYLLKNQIHDMSPLSALRNLTHLALNENQVSDISVVSGLTNLETLCLSSNEIANINPVAGLHKLTTLYLDENRLTDISSISKLSNLKLLRLTENQISDISPISNLSELTDLSIAASNVSDITALRALNKLEFLSISENQISDISPLSNLFKLETLRISDNQIRDITPLINLTGLSELSLAENLITDISVLSKLPQLKELDLESNQIEDINPISQLKLLRDLQLSGNNISKISAIYELHKLEWLDLADNRITSISALADLSELWHLDLSKNQINDISPLSTLSNLDDIDLRDNQISDISPLFEPLRPDEIYLDKNPLNSQAYQQYLPELEKRRFLQLSYDPGPDSKDLHYDTEQGITSLKLVVAVSFAVIIILAVVFIHRSRKVKEVLKRYILVIKGLLRRFKLIPLGLVILLGIFLLFASVVVFCLNFYFFFFRYESFYERGHFLALVSIVLGSFFTYIGTRFVDRTKSVVENAWLPGILLICLALFIPLFIAITHYEWTLSDITCFTALIIIGGILFWISRRRRSVT